MATLQNITFGDRDTTHLKYTGNWFLTGSYNASSVGQTGTLSSTSDLNAKVTFAFPQPVVAFYYYGIPRCCGGTYGICIDCDPNNPNFITIDAVNRTDDGHNPPVVLFSKTFDTLGMHEIIITNENDPRFGKSQLTIASIVLEVPVDSSSGGGGTSSGSVTTNPPSHVTITVSNPGSSESSSSSAASSPGTGVSVTNKNAGSITGSSSSSSSSSPTGSGVGTPLDANGNNSSRSSSSSPASHTPLGVIIGGVLAALAFFLLIIILAFWIRLRRRRRRRAEEAAADNNTHAPPSAGAVVHPFNRQTHMPGEAQSQFMTLMTETTTPVSASLVSSPSRRYGVTGKHSRPSPGAGQSMSTFSEATGISGSSSTSLSAVQSGGTGYNSNATRRREIDGGPIYSPVLPEEEEDTLPPDYMDVFAARRSTAQGRTTVGIGVENGAPRHSTVTRAMPQSDTSSSHGGGNEAQMDLSPVRRKN